MYQHQVVTQQLQALVTTLNQQIKELDTAIEQHIEDNKQIKDKVDNICKIKGLGVLTVAVILAETNGFILFENSRQLVSYAGYDVVENQSGNLQKGMIHYHH